MSGKSQAMKYCIRIALLIIAVAALTSCKVKSRSSCYANLNTIDGAKSTWASDTGATNQSSVTEKDLLPLLREMPKCPLGGKYDVGLIGKPPRCSRAEHKYP